MPKKTKEKKTETKSWFDTLGTGAAGKAKKALKDRKKNLDKRMKEMGA